MAEQNRENERRRRKREEYAAAFRAANPDKQFRLTKEQAAECKWSPEGLRVRLRLETAGVDCDLHDALALSNLRDGDRLVLYPRWTVDERLPAAERKEFTPTPKQMLYGQRAELMRHRGDREGRRGPGRWPAYAEVELMRVVRRRVVARASSSRRSTAPLEDGKLYTLDPCPNDWYGYWCCQVVEGLCRGEPNALYDRLADPSRLEPTTPRPLPGQAPFLAGLDAFQAAGLLHDFEKGKRAVHRRPRPGRRSCWSRGRRARARATRPPSPSSPASRGRCRRAGTSGSSSSCKTHAATDVLLKNVLEVREKLRELRDADPSLFAQYFDARLLDVPLYRVAPHDPPPDGVVHLIKDAEKEKGEDEERRRDPGAPLVRRGRHARRRLRDAQGEVGQGHLRPRALRPAWCWTRPAR